MRSASMMLVVGLLAWAPGCFLYVDGDGDGRHHWRDDEHDDDDDDDDDDDSGDPGRPDDDDEPAPALDVTLEISPGELTAGETTILTVVISGDVVADEVVDLDFGDGIEVLDVVLRGGGELLVAVDVGVDVSGEIDVRLDLGDLGTLLFPGAVVVVEGAMGGHDADPGGDPSGEDCP